MSPRKTRATARAQHQQLDPVDLVLDRRTNRKALGEVTGNANGAEANLPTTTDILKNNMESLDGVENSGIPVANSEPLQLQMVEDVKEEDNTNTLPQDDIEGAIGGPQLHQEGAENLSTIGEVNIHNIQPSDQSIPQEEPENNAQESITHSDLVDSKGKGDYMEQPTAGNQWCNEKIVSSDNTRDEINNKVDLDDAHMRGGAPNTEPSTPHRTDFTKSEAVQKLAALFEPLPEDEAGLEESSIAEILSRTPAAMTPRESLNVVQEVKGTTAMHEKSATKASQSKAMAERSSRLHASPKVVRRVTATKSNRPSISTSKPTTSNKATVTTRRSSVQASARPSSSFLQTTLSYDAVTNAKQKSAIAALHTPPKVAKSSKPPTRPSFQLPGDAITAKLKAQREERLQKEAEEARKRRYFKARPTPMISKSVEVKTTALSRGRMSLQAGVDGLRSSSDIALKALVRSSLAPGPRLSTASTTTKSRATSGSDRVRNLNVTATPGDGTNETKIVDPVLASQSSGKRNQSRPSASTNKPLSTRVPSGPKPAVSSKELVEQKQKGKEVFNRDRRELEQREKAMRDKAEAAKKARAQAAEKSRVASREWAERQKSKIGARNVSGSTGGSGSGSGSGSDTVVASVGGAPAEDAPVQE